MGIYIYMQARETFFIFNVDFFVLFNNKIQCFEIGVDEGEIAGSDSRGM